MKVELLPRSKAKTSWGLFREVRQAVLAEPKRLDMSTYVRDAAASLWPPVREDDRPACDTQGCVAGWMVILRSKPIETVLKGFTGLGGYRAESYAFSLLPSSPGVREDAHRLFHGSPDYEKKVNQRTGQFPRPYPWPAGLDAGTPRYAKAIVRNLDKFMAKHETALRKHKLPPVEAR
jgi:hypothetical protein